MSSVPHFDLLASATDGSIRFCPMALEPMAPAGDWGAHSILAAAAADGYDDDKLVTPGNRNFCAAEADEAFGRTSHTSFCLSILPVL